MLTVGSLFSGIGGPDLGLERAGMNVIWQSEIDDYASRVLKKHWPEVPNYGDIKEIDWQRVERPDVVCGGYPCQPFSLAGQRRGENDERHLWPYVREELATFDRDTQSWKTSGDISLWEEQPSLEILPLSGTTRNGTLFERPLLEHLIVENGCSLWPTPTSAAWTVATSMDAARRMVATRGPSSRLTEEVATTEPESNGFLNPEWVEWLMGFPPGWTDLKD